MGKGKRGKGKGERKRKENKGMGIGGKGKGTKGKAGGWGKWKGREERGNFVQFSATERYATGFSARTGPIRDSFVKFAELKLITVGYC